MTTNGGAIQKKSWGAVKKSTTAAKEEDSGPTKVEVDASAPRLVRLATSGTDSSQAIKLEDFDTSKLEISQVQKEGSIGDKFLEAKYNGNLLLLRFDDLPNFRYCPFKAGPARKKDGTQLGESWSFVVELKGHEYDKAASIEQHVIDTLKPRCEELMSHTLKKDNKTGKPLVKYTETAFERADFNSQLKPADTEKGYPASFRIGVQHEAVGKDGKARIMPKIWLTKLKGENQWTKPKPGTIHDLERGCAISAVVRLVRGIYFGNTGWGMRYTLHEAYIFTNMSKGSQPSIPTSHMQEVPDSDDEDEAVKTEVKEEEARPFMEAALIGYDDGSGGNGVAAE